MYIMSMYYIHVCTIYSSAVLKVMKYQVLHVVHVRVLQLECEESFVTQSSEI